MASEAAASARRQAARFLAMAMEAREKGNFGLAELLTDAANAAFDTAEHAEAPASRSSEPQQPAAQQQQQMQPNKKE